ncbi:hypothetical protein V7S43_018683 [Phytophthora oleae]|uniref:Tubulin-specific chaperone A n=1 Tax=Phytophthora oleae TaxID=2107226 RepID=A0ABD3EPW4_9STRA
MRALPRRTASLVVHVGHRFFTGKSLAGETRGTGSVARRQESYVRRERQYKGRIGELEALLSDSRTKKSKENTLDASMDRVRAMHQSIMESVDQVQHRTSKVLQEQVKDLLRAFRARLYSVQEEVESEKDKTDDGASAWIEKSNQLETEVEWTKELDDRLDGFTCARTSSSRSPIYTTGTWHCKRTCCRTCCRTLK